MQRRYHLWGFGRVPIDPLLEPMKDKLPEVAAKAGVDAIVFECNWAGEGVEIVDVTAELCALYHPNEDLEAIRAKVREWTAVQPVDLLVIEDHDHDH